MGVLREDGCEGPGPGPGGARACHLCPDPGALIGTYLVYTFPSGYSGSFLPFLYYSKQSSQALAQHLRAQRNTANDGIAGKTF